MQGRNIVVTGGAGFIGSSIARKLCCENDVIVIDDLSTGRLENIQDLIDKNRIRFVRGDINDLDLLKKFFLNVDYVFHEAAIASVPRSVKDPVKSNHVNLDGTLNVLVASRDKSVKKVVYASSSSVYGDTPTLPKLEDMMVNPLSPYAVSKVASELYCDFFTKYYGLSVVSLRYFNVYGPRQDPFSEYAAVIPKFIDKVLKGESPIIYGDGEQTRDFSFIEDIVDANILAAESEFTGILNIAGGKSVSINDLAKLVMEVIGEYFDITYDDPRPGDIVHSLADISKAEQNIGYEPKFSLLKGLEETVVWFREKI